MRNTVELTLIKETIIAVNKHVLSVMAGNDSLKNVIICVNKGTRFIQAS